MKRKSFVLLLFIAVLLVGCREEIDVADDWNLEKDKGVFLQDIKQISREKRPMDLVKYLDDKTIRMRSEELTESVYLLNKMQREHLEDYDVQISSSEHQKILERDWDKFENINAELGDRSEESFDFIEDESFRGKLNEIYAGNYLIEKSGEDYRVFIDYRQYKKYENSIDKEVRDYISIQDEDQEYEEGLDYSFEDLGSKLMRLEEHLISYGDGYGYEDLLRMYSNNLRSFFMGNEYLEVVEEGRVKSEVLAVYRSLAQEENITSNAIEEYLDEIESTEGMVTEEVEASILTIHNKAIALLER